MENAMARPRYTRRPVPSRRHRKAPRAEGGLGRLILRQLIISILLLVIICIVKGINFSAANYVTEKVKYVISYNVELKSVFAYIENLAIEIRDSISPPSVGTPQASGNQASNLNRASETNISSGAALTSSNTQTSDTVPATGAVQNTSRFGVNQGLPANQDTILSQNSAQNPAAAANRTSAPVPGNDTATLSSTESMQEGNSEGTEVNTTGTEDRSIVASSAIDETSETSADTSEGLPTGNGLPSMPETSVLSITSGGPENTTGMLLPVEGTLISEFGEEAKDASGTIKTHKGVDIGVIKSVAVMAALDGKVTETGSSPSYGGYVRILHSNDLQTIYANCSGISVKKGDIVKRGDKIAEIGKSGASVGIHLHFEVWVNGKAVDPLDYVNVQRQ